MHDVKPGSLRFCVWEGVRQPGHVMGREGLGKQTWGSVQGRTAFSQISHAAELLAAHSFFQQSHPGRTDPPAGVLCLLQGLLASVVEVAHPFNAESLLACCLSVKISKHVEGLAVPANGSRMQHRLASTSQGVISMW